MAVRRSPASTITPCARRSSRYVAADPIGTGSRPGRGPRLSPEAVTPATSAASTSPSSFATSQRIGPREPAAGPAHGARKLEARDGRRDRRPARRSAAGAAAPSDTTHTNPSRSSSAAASSPVLAREALPRLLGRVGARAAHLAPLRLAALRKAVCHDREPPGRDMDADALRRQAGPLELGGEEPGERGLRDAAVRRRQLLAADLDEQVRHRKRPPPSRDARPRRPASGAASAGCRRPGRSPRSPCASRAG